MRAVPVGLAEVSRDGVSPSALAEQATARRKASARDIERRLCQKLCRWGQRFNPGTLEPKNLDVFQTSMTVPFAGGGIAACCFLRSAMTSATQPVHVGSMSTTGRNSTTNVGNSSGWKPRSDQVMPAATTSRISSANVQPNGPRMNCSTSVVSATPYAPQMRCFVNTGGANRENVQSTEVPHCNEGTDNGPAEAGHYRRTPSAFPVGLGLAPTVIDRRSVRP